jgi:hypothetical protein
MPPNPVAVATSCLGKVSVTRAYNRLKRNWCAKAPIENTKVAAIGLDTKPMGAGPIVHTAPIPIPAIRELTNVNLKCLAMIGEA